VARFVGSMELVLGEIGTAFWFSGTVEWRRAAGGGADDSCEGLLDTVREWTSNTMHARRLTFWVVDCAQRATRYCEAILSTVLVPKGRNAGVRD
jgi:hypothetical protein